MKSHKTTLNLSVSLKEAFDYCLLTLGADNRFSIKSSSETKGTIELNSKISWRSNGEKIFITLRPIEPENTEIEITSQSKIRTTLVDFGKNRENAEAIAQILEMGERLPVRSFWQEFRNSMALGKVFKEDRSSKNQIDFKGGLEFYRLYKEFQQIVRANNPEDIPRRINLCQEMLAGTKINRNPSTWMELHFDLGNSFREYKFGDGSQNIENAIHHYEQALLVASHIPNSPDWADIQRNLAIAYSDRIGGSHAENIEKAIYHSQQALLFRKRDKHPEDWVRITHNLGVFYAARIDGLPNENLEQAINYYQQALEVATKSRYPRLWVTIQRNLASAYSNLGYQQIENRKKAISILQEVLEVDKHGLFADSWATTQFSLATLYHEAYEFDLAINHYNQALSVFTVKLFPSQFQATQQALGNLYFQMGKLEGALTAYQGVIHAGTILLDMNYTQVGRSHEISKTRQLYARTAYCLMQLNQPNAALQQIEQGKTRLLRQSLALDEASFTQLPANQQMILHTLRQKIQNWEGEMRLPIDDPSRRTDRALVELLHQARTDLNQQIAAIRADHPDFMPVGLDVPDILKLIPENGALVIPFFARKASFAFVIPYMTDEVTDKHIIPLSKLNVDTFQQPDLHLFVLSMIQLYQQFLPGSARGKLESWLVAINQTSQELWVKIMEPIHHQLQALDLTPGAHVLLIPQGELGPLPLHAAWRLVDSKPRYFCDDYTVIYAPSAYVLDISQRRAAQPERQTRSLFAAINPTGNLSYTPLEGETIANLFPSEAQTVLWEQAATTGAFFTAANGHAYLHYAGHGFYHWDDPLQSSLQLADKPCTLADILSGLDLSACRLVTLSACETGITEFQKSPDEYVGLPAGFLQAGAPAVISTLWAVNDLSTMLLMEKFYRLHLQDGLDIANALRQAQLWLRDVTAGELANRFGHEAQQLMTRLTKDEALEHWYRFENMDKGERPFAHPYYWAAFTFMGA